jgi:hypothetical protein
LLGLLGYGILWFVLLYPLIPSTRNGWVAWSGSGVLCAAALAAGSWLSDRVEAMNPGREYLVWKSIGAFAVVALGVLLLVGIVYSQDFVAANFTYRTRH